MRKQGSKEDNGRCHGSQDIYASQWVTLLEQLVTNPGARGFRSGSRDAL
jgi:hypothetical protein